MERREGGRENGGLPARKTLKVYGGKSCGLFFDERAKSPVLLSGRSLRKARGAREEMLTGN